MYISSEQSMAKAVDAVRINKKIRLFFRFTLLVVLTFSMLILTSCGKKDDETDNDAADGDAAVTLEPIVTPPDGITASANQDIVNLITLYYNALRDGDSATVAAVKKDVTEEEKIRLEVKAADIESFDNLAVFDQPGMNAGEYIVLIYSETKFAGIETRAPGLIATYVKPDESGSLCINSSVDEDTMNFVQSYVSGETIQNFYSQVQAAYADAIAKDTALNTYMQGMEAKLDAAVAERQAAAEAEAAATEAAEAEQTEETSSNATVNETVTAMDKVNVRVSDSENADRLGQVEAGATLTRYEVRENGWSKVDYNGQEGFIKSEYLKSAASTDSTPEEPAQTDSTTTTATTETSSAGTDKKVEAKETVKVRSSASTDSEVLGLIGPDEKFALIEEQSDGWSKIDYNGKTGYVKTEFVTIK